MPETVYIPSGNAELTLTEDWQVELEWSSENLVMLKHFNLTGMKRVDCGERYATDDDGNYLRDAQGGYVRVKVYRNETVVNPIFKDYEGNTTPALVTFVAGTKFKFSRFHADRRGVSHVYLKCTESERKGVKGKNILLPRRVFNGVVGDWSRP